VADVIYDQPAGLPDLPALVPLGSQEAIPAPEHAQQADLLVPVFRGGRAVYEPPPAAAARDRAAAELASFDGAVMENREPQGYLVGLEAGLHQLKNELAAAARAAERGG
jgi:nicotinate phosphoribosyltransferase